MNLKWFAHNLATSWRHRRSLRDFAARMAWIYAVPLGLAGREWAIGFYYPPPVGDIRLLVRTNRGADAFVHSEVFEHQYYHLLLTVPPTTVLDLGANIGLSAVYFGRLFPAAKLACVEPASDNLRILRRNLELNSVRGTVFAAAVDVADGTVGIELDANDYGHRTVPPGRLKSGKHEQVAAMSVPTLRRQLGWDRIGLLKVDIEGHERILFANDCGWLADVDAMCIECHDGFDETDLAALGVRYGFQPPQRLPGIWFMARP
jgi:FkbM family methyltransferase